MIFARADTYNGLPDRLYRLPEEINRDIKKIKEKIELTGERINVPNVISEILKEAKEREPESFIRELENLVADALDALFELQKLSDSLEILEDELKEVTWILEG